MRQCSGCNRILGWGDSDLCERCEEKAEQEAEQEVIAELEAEMDSRRELTEDDL